MRLGLLLQVAGVEARKKMAYRLDFWIQAIVVFAAELGVVWFVWTAVFETSGKETVGGYTRLGAVLYYVAVILVGKLVRGSEFGDTSVSQDIYEGSLSKYLLYPAPYVGIKYAQNLGALAPFALQLLLFGLLSTFILRAPDAAPTAQSLGLGLVSILAANLLYYLMSYAIQGVAFWADNVWSLGVAQRMASNFLGGVMVPLSVFPDEVRPVLDVLPFRCLFYDPANVLLGRSSVAEWASSLGLGLAWCAAFGLVGQAIFRRGMLRYSGVGI